jgi:hypothetical protein
MDSGVASEAAARLRVEKKDFVNAHYLYFTLQSTLMPEKTNAFLDLIGAGRIKTVSGLKSAFRTAAKKTHPDSSSPGDPSSLNGPSKPERDLKGAESSEAFIRLRRDYEEALACLEANRGGTSSPGGAEDGEKPRKADPRSSFYSCLYTMERASPPFWFSRDDPMKRYGLAWDALAESLRAWKPEFAELVPGARREYDAFIVVRYDKTELFSLRNIFFNIVSYHLSGTEYYRKRAETGLRSILALLRMSGSRDLEAFYAFLASDLKNGPAMMGEDMKQEMRFSFTL